MFSLARYVAYDSQTHTAFIETVGFKGIFHKHARFQRILPPNVFIYAYLDGKRSSSDQVDWSVEVSEMC